MINLSRRSFLGGALALAGTVVLDKARLLLPMIWGDGVNDDAPGLNALFSRMPVNVVNDDVQIVAAELIKLKGGRFRLSASLVISKDATVTIEDSYFVSDPGVPCIFKIDGDAELMMKACHLESGIRWKDWDEEVRREWGVSAEFPRWPPMEHNYLLDSDRILGGEA